MIAHKKQWEFLKRKFEQDQLSHAYLFTGEEGIGKNSFAKELAGLVGCKFPDLMDIGPGEESVISIAKIREVQSFMAYKSYNGGFRIVIVNQAEKMNQEAQSCFLKTLEEPKGQTLIILISSKPEMLLPTIYSRCQNIKFFRPKNFQLSPEKLARQQIILEGLLKVIKADFSEKFKYAKAVDFEKIKIEEILEVLQKYYRQKMLAKIEAGETLLKIKNVIRLIEEINIQTMFTNASPKLALEILLIETQL